MELSNIEIEDIYLMKCNEFEKTLSPAQKKLFIEIERLYEMMSKIKNPA